MKLSDLMTADQALKIIEMLEDLTKRIENLENEYEPTLKLLDDLENRF